MHSDRRNPILADVMAQLDYMEKRGSGLKRICNETRALPEYLEERRPVFRSTSSHFTTVISSVLYGQTGKGDVTNDVMKDVTYDVMNELSERQRAIVAMARVNPYVTGVDMSRMLHVSERTIRRDLSEMKHVMVHEGDRNDGKWVFVAD